MVFIVKTVRKRSPSCESTWKIAVWEMFQINSFDLFPSDKEKNIYINYCLLVISKFDHDWIQNRIKKILLHWWILFQFVFSLMCYGFNLMYFDAFQCVLLAFYVKLSEKN